MPHANDDLVESGDERPRGRSHARVRSDGPNAPRLGLWVTIDADLASGAIGTATVVSAHSAALGYPEFWTSGDDTKVKVKEEAGTSSAVPSGTKCRIEFDGVEAYGTDGGRSVSYSVTQAACS